MEEEQKSGLSSFRLIMEKQCKGGWLGKKGHVCVQMLMRKRNGNQKVLPLDIKSAF